MKGPWKVLQDLQGHRPGCHVLGAEVVVLLSCHVAAGQLLSPRESSVEEGREGPPGLGERALCPGVGLPPSIYNLNLYSGHLKAAASCIVVYIAQQSCKYVVLCINKPACFDLHGRSPCHRSCTLT